LPASRPTGGFYLPIDDSPEERAILVGVHLLGGRPGEATSFADLDELELLAQTAGAQIVGRMEQRRRRPDVRSLLGRGKLEQLRAMARSLDANLAIFDNELSPAQGRNLEKFLGFSVIDRTELILDIFVRHARTRQSRLQVELAQYEYLLPRLARMWTHLERQAGGIGTRGPGETQIETDRRLIRRRITHLRRELELVDRRMQTQNKRRSRELRVALVGYTNAGKSSLMNRITEAGVYVQDQLFATLDATTRRVDLSDHHQFLLTDTVGFLRKLPHHLVESFRATLSEVAEADLLLHVVDLSAEDYDLQIESVRAVLDEVAPGERAEILVFNKCDLVSGPIQQQIRVRHPEAVLVSAKEGTGIDTVLQAVEQRLRQEERQLTVFVPNDQPRSMAQLHELAQVGAIEWENGGATLDLRVASSNYGRVIRLPGVEILEIVTRGLAGGIRGS
jgi:GTP-binding protein HflX